MGGDLEEAGDVADSNAVSVRVSHHHHLHWYHGVDRAHVVEKRSKVMRGS